MSKEDHTYCISLSISGLPNGMQAGNLKGGIHTCGLTIFYAISHNMLHSHHSTIIKLESDFCLARLNKVLLSSVGLTSTYFSITETIIYRAQIEKQNS